MPKGAPGVPRGPRLGSATARLADMQLGDVIWFETSAEDYESDMKSIIVPRTRRTGIPDSREFQTRLYTAVGSGVGNILYLIRLERIT